MPQKSFIERLPPETREACDRILLRPGLTLEMAVPLLEEIGIHVSMSAIGRHRQKIEVLSERLRSSRAMADAIGKRIEDEPDDRMAALNREMLHHAIMKLMMAAANDDDATMSAKEIKEIAEAVQRVASASKMDAERTFKVRKQMAEETAKAVGDELVEREPGMSAETVAAIKKRILGLA